MSDVLLSAHHLGLLRQQGAGHNHAAPVLNKVSLELAQGDIHMLLGPNGAGKSTLLKILSAEIQASFGEVRLQGKMLKQYSLQQLAQQRAVLSQLNHFMFPMTVYEVCALGRTPYMGARLSQQDKSAIGKALELLELSSYSSKDYSNLSGGEQQRVHIARVLCQETPLLFLDEPLSALDIRYQFKLLDLLADFAKQGKTILCVMHDINLSLRYGSHLTFLKQGEVVFQGRPQEIDSAEMFERVYDVKAKLLMEDDVPQIRILGTS